MIITETAKQDYYTLHVPVTEQYFANGVLHHNSGKTLLILRAIAARAIKAPGSRHAVLRFRFNALKSAIIYDTWPKMMALCWPGVSAPVNKQDWFAPFPNGSQVWFGGLDDKERTEKILGNEYASIFFNECSQIPWSSRNMALTRLAQRAVQQIEGEPERHLSLRAYYDCNPPDRSHWTYRAFIERRDPESRESMPAAVASRYAAMQINPADNSDNLPTEYLEGLAAMSARMQRRFRFGEFREANPNALFASEHIDKWRVIDRDLPDMQRVVIAVDPSGADEADETEHDEIGITVCGLGTDGNGYMLEDLTIKAGPATWGRLVASAYDRHMADRVVAEVNFGGAMVKHVIQSARVNTPFFAVTASRGKVVRAEPISSMIEQGRIRIVGYMPDLEDELSGFTTAGYVGDRSPNRADAMIWGMTALFPSIVRGEQREQAKTQYRPPTNWMSA